MALNFLLKRSGTADKRPDPTSMALGELDLNYDATTGGVFYKDSDGDVVKVGSAQVSATAPNAAPVGSAGNSTGEFWYDTGTSSLKMWDGTSWVSTGGGGGGGVVGVTGTAPITVDNTDPANPIVGVNASSTTAAGVVQLNNTVVSTSVTVAATANAVKTAYDEAALAITDAATAQGTADFAQADATQALSDAAAAQSTANAAIPCAALTAKGNLIVATTASTPTALPVGTDGQVLTACSACSTGVTWAAAGGGSTPQATPTVLGTVFGWDSAACLSTAYGRCALRNVNALCNVAVGFEVMCNIASTSSANVAIGLRSSRNLNGCFNVLIGSNSGGGFSQVAAMAGSANVAVGSCAMGCAFNVDASVAVGSNAGCTMCGGDNVAVGTNAMSGQNASNGATGAQNVAVGQNAMSGYTTGSCNTAIGRGALCSVFSGSCHTAVGHGALANATSGSTNNLAIGIFSGTTGGAVSGLVNLTTASNNIVLGNFNHTCAQIKVAWTVTSDERDKAIDPAGVPYGLAFVNQIEPIAYCWCDRATGEVTEDRKRFGFSAQNIQALETSTTDPVIISADDPEHLNITDHMLLPVLVNAIKELSAKNDALEARIAQLEGA